jgi:hypothetical protein
MFFKGLVDGTVFLKWIWTGFSSDVDWLVFQ